jgi:threonine dehydrogenase-like Zn-dependent dehydrogenase
MNGGDYGQKISVECKAGAQKYSGKHLQEAIRHAKKYGATQVMLVYDGRTNLPEAFRPMKIMFRSQQRLTIAVSCLEERAWVTAREIFEVLQIINPSHNESKHEINLAELEKAVSAIQGINATIDKLRKNNNTMIRCCEGTRTSIDELETAIFSYQNRLRQVLYKKNCERVAA